jgi:hypothetical protein
MSVNIYQTTRHRIPEDTFHSHHYENSKSHRVYPYFSLRYYNIFSVHIIMILVTEDGVLLSNWIYCNLTTHNYK